MKSPFKFLDSYTLADRKIFFGRDQEITELYRRVFEGKILLVYGISGTGKSSLINCGLASRFDDSDWLPVNIRRGNNIIDSLNDAFIKQAITPLKNSLKITEKLQSIYLDHFKPVYLLFDQFEELFLFGSQLEKEGFISIVKEITESEIQCRIIFIIREEFLAGMTEFEEKLPDIFTNRFRVEKMKRANAITAVEGPCKVFDIEIEAGFSEELIDKLCQSVNEIELTYLQIYLDRIFRLAIDEQQAMTVSSGALEKEEHQAPRTGDRGPSTIKFTNDLLTKAGSVSDLLGQFLDEQIREMEDTEKGMAILKSFVSVQGTKKQMNDKEIQEALNTFGTEISDHDLIKYLEKFVDLRILREKDEAGHFELRHDALAAKIYEYFTLAEKELLEVRQFIENAYQAFKTRNTYLTQDDLEYLATYEKRLFLSTELDQFVKQSKEKLFFQHRALKRLTGVVAVVFLLLVALGARYYFNQKGSSKTKELINLALLQMKADPLTSLNIAYEAWQKDTISTILQGIIFDSFYDLLNSHISSGNPDVPAELVPINIPVKDSICSMKMSRSGYYLCGWTMGKETFIHDLNKSSVQKYDVSYPVEDMEVRESSGYFAVIYKNNTGEVFDRTGKSIFIFPTTINRVINSRLVRFFPSGRFFMAAVNGNAGQVYDSTGKCIFNLEGHTGNINSLDISPDGRFIATVSSDLNLIVWNYNHKTGKFSRYNTFKPHRDTIWSCEFNSTGKHILTSSADSMIMITNLDGVIRRGNLFFVSNRKNVEGYYFMRKELFADTSKKLFNPYKFKVNDANFGAQDRVIIASNYSYARGNRRNTNEIFRSQVLYFGNSYLMQNKPDAYFKRSGADYSSDIPDYYLSWSVSPDRLLFASVPLGKNETNLCRSDGYILTRLQGTFPCFSVSNEYIYYLKDKSIFAYPTKPDRIFQMALEKKIFGDPGKGKRAWKII